MRERRNQDDARDRMNPHGEEARSAVSNHEAPLWPTSFETRLAPLLRMRR
jgi:hypothetical protein